MINATNTNYSAVYSVQSGQQINWDEYCIDEDGPSASIQPDYGVRIPGTQVNIREEHSNQMKQIANSIRDAGDEDGIDAFLVLLDYLQLNYH